MSEWKPIETAPIDGRPVWVETELGERGFAYMANIGWGSEWVWAGPGQRRCEYAEKWMLLPELPK